MAAQHTHAPIRRDTHAHKALRLLMHAGEKGMTARQMSLPGAISAPGKHVTGALERLEDHHLAAAIEGIWRITPAGASVLRKLECIDVESSPPSNIHVAQPMRRDIFATGHRELPLVLRPGADDFRALPSRRGNALVYDHLASHRGPT
jgi:hypothetical protein